MLNIIVLTNMDVSAHYALSLLLPAINNHNVHIFKSSKVGGTKNLPKELVELGQFESRLLQSSDFKSSPLHSATLLDNINTPEGFKQVSKLKPDVILSIRFGKILKNPIIKLPKLGVLNLHSGLLPEFKGVMATFWGMLNTNEKQVESKVGLKNDLIGATIHSIDDASIDTGKIISRIPVEIERSSSYWWNVLNVYKYSVPELVKAVQSIENGRKLNGSPQKDEGDYFSYPTEESMLAFYKKGFKLFEPSDLSDFLNETLS
ncbi:formyl transferase [Psychrosphaera haliotis]|uniref:Formyl transferase n=1 Tax=Psychrosphaera haliotis TaxID=555083 RepID=A0A6N8F850_9GAMM|nr:formyl transferase [Psychrosphaera haliotis]MUH72428.1 formyl transferase [Psychrosphaera haliotis]